MASTADTTEVCTPVDDTPTELNEDDLTSNTCSNNDTKPTNDPGGCLTDTGKIVTQETGDQNLEERVNFKVIYNKSKYDVNFGLDETVKELKEHIQTLTGVPQAMQKLMFRGLAKDELTLRELKVTKGAKIMVVGSTLNDVLSVSAPSKKELAEAAKAEASAKEPFSEMKQHKKVLDKYGKPEDITPGYRNRKEPLPTVPLSGMYNKSGGKVRLTFKLESDQLWIGTKERTDKIPMNSIKAVVSEPIKGHEDYHLMGIQLGPTEASRYWIYWVPAQYADSVKDSILGKWQLF
ncbi:hypothetical protein SNE40_020199 [Patella caerulea]|uniref:Ubiquitin-like domain-containing protein n=1 Tax=Patella caerulea TaxID=87958 RepID=A0AAN8G9Z0_PATCE